MCVSSVLFLVDFFVHASPHQLWRHCRNFLEQQTGFLSQRTAFVCVVSVFIAVGFKNLLNPAKVKYHHLQTPPSYLFFPKCLIILTRAAPPPLLSLCSFSLPSSIPAAPLLTSSLFLLRHPPLSCRLGLAPAAVVLLSLLVRTPNRAWIWKTTPLLPYAHIHPPPSSPSLTLAPLHPTSCLHRADLRLAWTPVLVSFSPYFSPSLFYSRLCLPPSSSSSSSLSLNVSPTLNSTHSGWAALCEWVAAYTAWNWKRHASFDKYRQFCMETGRVLTLRFLLPQHFLTCSAAVLLCWHRFHENKGKLILFKKIVFVLSRMRSKALCTTFPYPPHPTCPPVCPHICHHCVFRCMCAWVCVQLWSIHPSPVGCFCVFQLI